MEKMLEIYDKEIDILCLEAEMVINHYSHPVFFMEDGSTDKTKTNIKKIFDSIMDIIDRIKKMITDFFQSNAYKEKMDTLDKTAKADPNIKNKKVKVKDYDKLDKLNKATLKELQTTKDPEAVIEKYKKQRNAIMAAATVVITVGGFLVSRNHKKHIKDMEDVQNYASSLKQKYEKLLSESEYRIKNLTDEFKNSTKKMSNEHNSQVKQLNTKVKNMQTTIKVQAKQINNSKEVIKQSGIQIKRLREDQRAAASFLCILKDNCLVEMGDIADVMNTAIKGYKSMQRNETNSTTANENRLKMLKFGSDAVKTTFTN